MYIAFYDESTDTVWFGLVCLGGDEVDTRAEPGRGERKAGQGRTEEIICAKRPLLSEISVELETRYKTNKCKGFVGQPFASWLGVPMMVGDRVLGVIATYHAMEEYVCYQDDVQALSTMANQAAIAFDNARHVHELNQNPEAFGGSDC